MDKLKLPRNITLGDESELHDIQRTGPSADNLPQERGLISFLTWDYRFASGIWIGEPGDIPIKEYPVDEFCYLSEGEVLLVSADGQKTRFAAGDSFVVPAGFSGVWQTLRRTTKRFAFYGDRESVLAMTGGMLPSDK